MGWRKLVYRRHVEGYTHCCMLEGDSLRGGSALYREGSLTLVGPILLSSMAVLTATRYRGDVLTPHV